MDAIRRERAMHPCFSNYGGQTVRRGFWQDLIPFFYRLHVDHLLLEFARRGYAELESFKEPLFRVTPADPGSPRVRRNWT